jgi:hypothetical protein
MSMLQIGLSLAGHQNKSALRMRLLLSYDVTGMGGEKIYALIAVELGGQVSAMTVCRTASMKKTKLTRRPRLTVNIKAKATRVWQQAWKNLPQTIIQAYIKRIEHQIKRL